MTLKPLGDRVLIEQREAAEVTSGGIVLPENAKTKQARGKVLATGPGRISENGDLVKMNVAKGQDVLYDQYAGSEIEIDGEKRIVVRESEIIAIVG